MEIFEKLGIKLPNAVLVHGVTEVTETDDYEEVLDFLKNYGAIERSEMIKDSLSEFNHYMVVEYSSGIAVQSLKPLLPHKFVTDDKANTFIVQGLSDLYTENVGKTTTQSYLADLKKLAHLSGKDYREVLKDMVSQIGESITDPTTPGEPPLKTSPQTSPQKPPIAPDLNPPEIQRYVVEHIVKSEDNPVHMFSSQKLRVFSGKVPRPSHEVDYDSWRSSVDLIMKDPAVSDLLRSRKILESLLPPAADMIKHLNPDTLPAVYLQLLDSAFGTVQDGDELYAKFMDTVQDAVEKPSTYLQRLHVALNLTVKRGGIPAEEVDKHLLNQFCRGCWDNALLSELQLKHKKANPPSFADLLLLLRTEEDREAAKTMRMNRHLGTKQKVTSHWQVAYSDKEEQGMCATFNVNQTLTALTKQIADIQNQLASLTANQQRPASNRKPFEQKKSPATAKPMQSSSKNTTKPNPGYCFHCGEDGHIKPQCDKEPNPALVAEKRKRFNLKCQKWEKQNPDHLN